MDAQTDLLAWLASGQGSTDAPDLLAKLAEAFQAEGAGLAGPLPQAATLAWWKTGIPERAYPWQQATPPVVSNRIYAIDQPDRSWLVARLAGPLEDAVLAWIAVSPPRSFSAKETELLAAAGLLLWQALERSQPDHPWLQGLRQARLVQRLEQSARLTGKLAHDFGNLLTGVLGFAELALTQATPGSISHQFVTEILDSAREGASWIHRLQAFSRRISHRNASCDFRDILSREEDRLRPAWQGKSALMLDVPVDLPPVAVDAADLENVLAQLLDNAFEATEPPGVVTLAARQRDLSDLDTARLLGRPRPGAFLEVTISHTGYVLPQALLEGRLDDVFIDMRKRHRGLGLLVVYGILMNFGGALEFSQALPKGAGVRAYLPLKGSQPPLGP